MQAEPEERIARKEKDKGEERQKEKAALLRFPCQIEQGIVLEQRHRDDEGEE